MGGSSKRSFESHPPDSPLAKRFKLTVVVVREGRYEGVGTKGLAVSSR